MLVATILLGVATKATGSGLACNANWPLCDGGVLDLFPATFPSFFEWIHRVVAGVAGLFIVGTAVAAWRDARIDRRITLAVTLGTLLTPVQVLLGRETVLQYDMTILSMHYWTAILIFTLFVVSTVLVWANRVRSSHVAVALGLGAAVLPLHVALSPLFIGSYTPVIQTAQYAVTLALLGAVVLATVVGRRRFDDRRLTAIFAVSPPLTLLVMLFGRRAVMTFAPLLDTLYVLATAALFVTLVAGIVTTRRLGR